MAHDGQARPEGNAPAEGASAAAASNRVDAKASLLGLLSQLTPGLDGKIANIKNESTEAKAAKKRLAKELRHAEKTRRRLRARCKELPAEDVLEVLAMRQVKDAEVAAAGSTE